MNVVPIAFWENVCGIFSLDKDIDAFPKKFVRTIDIYLFDTGNVNVSRGILKRFPNACYNFILSSSPIEEAWVDFACSLKRLGCVAIAQKMGNHDVPLLLRLVNGKTLWKLMVYQDNCEGRMMEVLKSILCQDQFKKLKIRNGNSSPWESTVVPKILEFWSENSTKLGGKNLVLKELCRGGVEQLEKFILHRTSTKTTGTTSVSPIKDALEVCSKEECDSIERYYQHHHFLFDKPSCVYKFQEGEADDRRRMYISFECSSENEKIAHRCANQDGHNDLNVMQNTSSLHVLFA
uniref:FBA_2 domain-containing protein n=1 Tax=Steinernema glaseri TaxID=37863 RepID=A0A1I8A4P9_9BILA